MIDDSQVLGLGLELLVRVLAGAAHHGVGGLLSLHLLGDLAGGVIGAEEEDVDELKTEDAEEVP